MKARCYKYFCIVMVVYGRGDEIPSFFICHLKTCLTKGDKRMNDKKQYQYKMIPDKSHTQLFKNPDKFPSNTFHHLLTTMYRI